MIFIGHIQRFDEFAEVPAREGELGRFAGKDLVKPAGPEVGGDRGADEDAVIIEVFSDPSHLMPFIGGHRGQRGPGRVIMEHGINDIDQGPAAQKKSKKKTEKGNGKFAIHRRAS